jgi:ankyrin repeat protein
MMLVEHGAVVDATEYKVTTTPLLIAAFSNQTDVASYLLAKGADVRRQSASPKAQTINLTSTHLQQPNKAQNDSAGTTPLFAAALQGDLATVDILLEAGADPNFVCVFQKSTHVEQQCFQSTLTFNGGNWHSDTSGYTTVMSACDSPALGFEGRQPLAIVRKLLDLGVPINHAAYSRPLLDSQRTNHPSAYLF